MSGVIYQLICKSNKLKYIGLATNFKYKNGLMAILGVLASYTAHSPEKQLGPKVF